MIHNFICSSCRAESFITGESIEPDFCPYCGNDEDNEITMVDDYTDQEDTI